MENTFQQVLNAAVAPIVLISGVGLLLLSLINRFSHATARTRALVQERRNAADARREILNGQIAVLRKRCHILQLSVGCVVASTGLSSLIVVGSTMAALADWHLDTAFSLALIGSFLAVVAATLLLLYDVSLSVKAIDLECDADP